MKRVPQLCRALALAALLVAACAGLHYALSQPPVALAQSASDDFPLPPIPPSADNAPPPAYCGSLTLADTQSLTPLDTKVSELIEPREYLRDPLAVDFDGDGKLDLAVTSFFSGEAGEWARLSVLRGAGDGTFARGSSYLIGRAIKHHNALAAGDFNGDGKPDLVAAVMGRPGPRSAYVPLLALLFGQGGGTFAAPLWVETPFYAARAHAADFDGDGRLDLAVLGEASNTPASALILFGQGGGSFATGGLHHIAPYPTDLAVADFNGDSKPDFAVTNLSFYDGHADSGVLVFLNRGDGTFDWPTRHKTGPHPQSQFGVNLPASIVTGDFNGDSKMDMVVGQQSGGSGVKMTYAVLLNVGGGQFESNIFTTCDREVMSSTRHKLAAGDFDGDGKLDLVTYLVGPSILRGNGDGTFAGYHFYHQQPRYHSPLVVGDFNGDGRPDLFGINGGGSSVPGERAEEIVLLNRGAALPPAPTPTPTPAEGAHRIAGRITDRYGKALKNVKVVLSGDRAATATTDHTGSYAFGDVPGGGNYRVTPQAAVRVGAFNYYANPGWAVVNNLGEAQQLNFAYNLSSPWTPPPTPAPTPAPTPTPSPTPGPADQGQDGQLLNAGFDQGQAHWSFYGPAQVQAGRARLTPRPMMSAASITQWVRLTPGATYEVSADLTASGGVRPYLGVRWFTGGGGPTQRLTAPGGRIRVRFTVPADVSLVGVYCAAEYGSVTSLATADNFELTRIN